MSGPTNIEINVEITFLLVQTGLGMSESSLEKYSRALTCIETGEEVIVLEPSAAF